MNIRVKKSVSSDAKSWQSVITNHTNNNVTMKKNSFLLYDLS